MSERVLVITTSYPAYPGDAAGHFVATEAEQLARSHDVTVLAPGVPSRRAHNLTVIGVPDGTLFGFPGALAKLKQKPWLALGALRFVRHARRIIETSTTFSRVVAHWIVPSAWPIALALRPPASLEIVAHGSDVRLLLALPTRVRSHCLGALLEAGATFRFVSHELAEQLCRHAPPALVERTRVSASPLDLEKVPERSIARERLQIPSDERVAVVIGRLIVDKRVTQSITAGTLAGARVIVIGDGPERETLQRAFPHVTFLGQRSRPETLSYLAAADVLICASRSEGAPSVVREARALGIPVAAVSSGDLRDWATRDRRLLVVQ